MAFDLNEGGVLCRSCRSGVPISAPALALLHDVLDGRLNEALAAPESPATHEVGVLATRAMEHHLERRLRTVAIFERADPTFLYWFWPAGGPQAVRELRRGGVHGGRGGGGGSAGRRR